MIIGHISNFKNEAVYLPEALQTGLQYLAGTTFSSLADGKYPIDGDSIFAIVSRYTPRPLNDCKAETHVKYIDIQFVVSGKERLGFAPWSDSHAVLEDCRAGRDAIFYRTVHQEDFVDLKPGMYAVLFPWDVHRPGCLEGESGGEVLKVVLKIALDRLGLPLV